MPRVLVTGGAGFIGLPLVAELARRGWEVHALSTRDRPSTLSDVRWHRLDLAESATVDEMMCALAPERLVHLAWYTKPGSSWHAAENVLWVERSLHLIRSFVRHGGRRMLVLGTCAEYDWSAAEGPLEEYGSCLEPRTLYGVTKDALRRLARAYAEQEGVQLAWARPFLLYGPREKPERLVPALILSLLAGKVVATSSGEQVRDFMHVEDVAAAVAALLDSTVVGDINIATGSGVTVNEVIEQVVELTGRSGLVNRGGLPERPGEPPFLVADITRLRDEVGFRPSWTLEAGLAATLRWWKLREEPPEELAAQL
jgi:nucleoside-diphosphate-sugar epimerase